MQDTNHIDILLSGLLAIVPVAAAATPAKFDIPGDFPGVFQIDFLGTDFKLNGSSTGALSTASTIQFSVGAETGPGSGIYNTTVSPSGFSFLGFQAIQGLSFDVYGAGTGTGTFDAITGHWTIDMPTLFVNTGGLPQNPIAYATRLDFHLTTENVFVPDSLAQPGYWTTTATPMVIDETSPEPWGDLNLVAGGIVPHASELSLNYDPVLIASIATRYTTFMLDPDIWTGVQYEFDIYGNDPLVNTVPVPAAAWLFGSGVLALIGLAVRRKPAHGGID